MPNRNYQRGVRWEREIIKDAQSKGFKTIRASGSHGEFDVVCYKDKEIMFIQAKVKKSTKNKETICEQVTPSGFYLVGFYKWTKFIKK